MAIFSISAASIGQVHAATLADGTDVVVKVRQPGVVEQVDEDLEILQNLAAAASRRSELADQYDLVGLTQEFARALRSELAARLAIELPRQLRRLLADLERGDLEFAMRPTGFDPLLHQAERLINRLVLGMLAASFIVGLAVLAAVYRPPGWEQLAGAAFVVGFIVAAAIGVYLAISIARSGRL